MDGGREWRSQLGKWEANHIFFKLGVYRFWQISSFSWCFQPLKGGDPMSSEILSLTRESRRVQGMMEQPSFTS